jgi:pimeloyl-ACP methyl ester carboxylesterase
MLTGVFMLSGAITLAALGWLAVQWNRLKHTPALTGASRRAGIDGAYVQAGAYRMFYRCCRNGSVGSVDGKHSSALHRPPVVLVHGLVVSSRYMEPLAAVLGREFDVYAPDLPGFGESALKHTLVHRSGHSGHAALTICQLADALHLWLSACSIESAMFVGNSFGCQILADFASRYPQRVERLVLQAPTPDPRARSLLVQIGRDYVNGRREQPRSPAAEGRIDYVKAGLPRAIATMRMLVRDPIEDRLPRIAAPTLVVAGTRDPVSPLEWAEQAAHLLPHGSLKVIEGGTHTLNYAYPHAFALAITPFLRGEAVPPARDSTGQPAATNST